MKQYYIDDSIQFNYPYEAIKETKKYGVLSKYMGKYFTQKEIDKIICELFTRHPYIENAMDLRINILWINEDENMMGFYHIFNFPNDDYEKQKPGNLEIKYKNNKIEKEE